MIGMDPNVLLRLWLNDDPAQLSLFAQGSCGFADCLVVAKHARQGCEFTATFDRGMRKLPGVKLL
ncbi:MAG: hypothetical protein JNJ71_21535 [Rubrivivax sp.]|nr:hypothetical protein [Rubrivivax sp.]